MSTTDDNGLRDTDKIAGHLSLWFCEQIWGESGPISLDRAGRFSPADDEDMASLGYGEDDNTILVLRRESDGAFFEVEMEPYIRRVQPKEAAAEAAS